MFLAVDGGDHFSVSLLLIQAEASRLNAAGRESEQERAPGF
jgi:hypothetical protein